MIKTIVATDMDGTFLDSQGRFDNKRLEAVLDKFAEKGLLFVAASGRSLMALERMFDDYRHRMAFIAENGTLVKLDSDFVFEASMTKEQYLEIVNVLTDSPYMHGYDFLLSGEKGAYLHPEASDAYLTFISEYYDNVQRVPDLAAVKDTILKVTANFSEHNVREGEAWFNARIGYAQAVTTGFISVDIVVRDVTKRTALEHLCRKLNLDSANVIAFGDNLNDYEMLEFAGTAIATENARSEVKAIATEVIGPCEEESVMTYLEGMVN